MCRASCPRLTRGSEAFAPFCLAGGDTSVGWSPVRILSPELGADSLQVFITLGFWHLLLTIKYTVLTASCFCLVFCSAPQHPRDSLEDAVPSHVDQGPQAWLADLQVPAARTLAAPELSAEKKGKHEGSSSLFREVAAVRREE